MVNAGTQTTACRASHLSPRAILATISASAGGHLPAELWLPPYPCGRNMEEKHPQATQVICSKCPLQSFCKDLRSLCISLELKLAS